jgi:phospholipid/cholesterol/gamma-HCH transport system permease protein
MVGTVLKPLALLGVWSITRWRRLAGSISIGVAVLWQACRPVTWRRTVNEEFMRNCAQIILQGLPSIIATALLIGLAMVHQVLYWLQFAGQEGFIGEFLLLGLVREGAPVLVGMIVIGRSGSTMMVELGAMRRRRTSTGKRWSALTRAMTTGRSLTPSTIWLSCCYARGC